MERFIQNYFRTVSGTHDAAVRSALDKLRDFLREHDFDDFVDGDAFADALLGEMERTFAAGWAGDRPKQLIRDTSRSIYEFYRLRDLTPFGDISPIGLRLGGPDRVSIGFIGRLDHFYFSKFADNTREPMRKFFVDRYFKDGAALFGRESSDELNDFRKAAGERFENLTLRQINTVVQTAVARTRNWAHIGTMEQAEIELARLVATLDARTTPLCETIDGKLVRVGVAHEAIERLGKLGPADFAKQLYGSDIGKALSKDPVLTIEQYIEADGKTISDELVRMGRGFPPFHPNCRTRMEGVVPGAGEG